MKTKEKFMAVRSGTLQQHKQHRLQFAKERIHWKKKWRKVIFSDEKKN